MSRVLLFLSENSPKPAGFLLVTAEKYGECMSPGARANRIAVYWFDDTETVRAGSSWKQLCNAARPEMKMKAIYEEMLDIIMQVIAFGSFWVEISTDEIEKRLWSPVNISLC